VVWGRQSPRWSSHGDRHVKPLNMSLAHGHGPSMRSGFCSLASKARMLDRPPPFGMRGPPGPHAAPHTTLNLPAITTKNSWFCTGKGLYNTFRACITTCIARFWERRLPRRTAAVRSRQSSTRSVSDEPQKRGGPDTNICQLLKKFKYLSTFDTRVTAQSLGQLLTIG